LANFVEHTSMEVAAAIIIATLAGPFLIGWWIGHPPFAAAAWGALGLTVLIRQAQIDSSEGLAFLWILVATVISMAAAWYGALRRERSRQRELERR
jgi:hypothetical protein